MSGGNKESILVHPVLASWHALVANATPQALDGLLAPDVVFHSPVVHSPKHGRAVTSAILQAAFAVLVNEHWNYVGEWARRDSAVLEFETRLDGIDVNGVDSIHWNDDNQIVLFKAMIRPLKAVHMVRDLMAKQLGLAG